MKFLKYSGLAALVFLVTSMANAAVISASGALADFDADGDLALDDTRLGQVLFDVTAAGQVTIDLTTSGEFNSYMFLFDMATHTVVAENDNESPANADSYLAVNLAAGSYMVGIGSTLTMDFEALQGYMQDFTFADNRYWDSTAATGDWSVVINTPSSSPSPVPVPAALPLFASALLGLLGLSRRRR